MNVNRNIFQENECHVINEQARKVLEEALAPFFQGMVERTAVNIVGSAGVGKSEFLKYWHGLYKNETAVYIEVSACDNEIQIFKMLVDQLHGYQPEIFVFSEFRLMYEWFYGEYSKLPRVGADEEEKLENYYFETITDRIKHMGEDIVGEVVSIILGGGVCLPFSIVFKVISRLGTDRQKGKGSGAHQKL